MNKAVSLCGYVFYVHYIPTGSQGGDGGNCYHTAEQ